MELDGDVVRELAGFLADAGGVASAALWCWGEV